MAGRQMVDNELYGSRNDESDEAIAVYKTVK